MSKKKTMFDDMGKPTSEYNEFVKEQFKLGFDETSGIYLEHSTFGYYDPKGSNIERSMYDDEEEEDDSWLEF